MDYDTLSFIESIAGSLDRIDHSLATLAELAQMLILEKTGEKTVQVQRFVVGRDSEDNPCIWLYGTHPKLEYAVTRIYHEYLDKLPLAIPDSAKLWDGEQAPSADKAARGGYFCLAPAPFTISLMPTGAKTESGHDIRRFSRVISIDGDAPAPTNGARPAPASSAQPAAQPDFDKEFDALPTHPRSAYQPAPSKPAYMTTSRPWTGDVAAEALRDVAGKKTAKGEGVEQSDGKFGAVIGLLDSDPFDTDCRHEFLRSVFDANSAKDLTGAQRLALVIWAKPSKANKDAPWTLAQEAITEYRRILGWADPEPSAPELAEDDRYTEDDLPF